MRSKLFTPYVVVMSVAVGAFAFAPETEWVRLVWQMSVGMLAALFTIIGTRGMAGRAAWLFVAAGVFLNSSGILVEGIVYRLDPDFSVHTLDSGIIVSNGPCWSPDGDTFYFADSWSGEIWAYDYDQATGGV